MKLFGTTIEAEPQRPGALEAAAQGITQVAQVDPSRVEGAAPLIGPLESGTAQHRLIRIQTYNWGTFSNLFDFAIPREGYLFVGPSGSGKSTILDAHAALLTPPKWVDFNVAAREAERHGRDRSVVTYLRGAWAQQTGEGGEHAMQYLRPGTTWSAIAETYDDGSGRAVTIAQVLWIRGASTSSTDAQRLYLVLERTFDLSELSFFPESDFDVRRFKAALPDASLHREFSGYQERFRRLLGIDKELALRLLHKTQSAKNLGDLNAFLRDFMLDPPETFEIADRLVSEFQELNAAHQSVVTAREQIDTLAPARVDHAELDGKALRRNLLQTLELAIDGYREHVRKRLIDARIAELHIERDGAEQESLRCAAVLAHESDKLAQLERQKAGMALGVIDQLQRDLEHAEGERPLRVKKRDQAAQACAALGWDLPDGPLAFVQRTAAASERLHAADQRGADLEARKDELKHRLNAANQQFAETRAEIAALERQRSNLPARLLELRQSMAQALGISESKLPFVGELIEVRPDAAEWQGAIERVLGGFARSMLVEERHYAAVSTYVNERHIGERLAYFRVVSRHSGNRGLSQESLVRKLNLAQGPFRDWVLEELKTHFDFECASSLQAFRAATRAVTREGQIKHNAARHEKNDRDRIDDRSRWVLGFDNRAKLALYQQRAAEVGQRIADDQATLNRLNDEQKRQHSDLLACNTLANLTWAEVDVGSLLAQIDDLKKRLEAERAARPEIAELDVRIETQRQALDRATGRRNDVEVRLGRTRQDIATLERRLETLLREHPGAQGLPSFAEEFEERFAALGRAITLESIDNVASSAARNLSSELRAIESSITDLRNAIVQRLAEFNRRWPAESGGLDANIASADDYFAKLARLQTDNLPAFEERFLRLLREQSDQNLALLSTKLDLERAAIRARMELVNESLSTALFNRDTYLVIETADKTPEDVRQFRAALKEALSRSLGGEFRDEQALRAAAEQRFALLAALVKRLASQESADRQWRALVLDVRQHVEFVARELDEHGVEQDVYRSGAGKSGGQRQKLAATCLAAALRYQLGGQDRSLPGFATVVLDEAFDKADAEFTAIAMNIFKTFGFQMIVATPLKSVMTLEPFIGGACFVHIADRKRSTVIPIAYDQDQKRLDLPQAQRAAAASRDEQVERFERAKRLDGGGQDDGIEEGD